MEKKTECEIVQDLLIRLFVYLSARHLYFLKKHCYLSYFFLILYTINVSQFDKASWTYLKKIRLKNRVKSIFGSMLILVVIFVGWYLYKFSILTGLAKKAEKQLESENFYIESIGTLGTDGEVSFESFLLIDYHHFEKSHVF